MPKPINDLGEKEAIEIKEVRISQKAAEALQKKYPETPLNCTACAVILEKTKPIKPLFLATEMIECPLPMVKRQNPVSVDAYCHGWAFKNELCHFANTCAPYLELLQERLKEGKPVNLKILTKRMQKRLGKRWREVVE